MAARTETVGGGSFGIVLIGSLALVMVAAGLVICGDVLNNHAWEKHGTDATTAEAWIYQNGNNCRYDCPDGRIRYACEMDNGKWALMVTEDGQMITAFFTSHPRSARNFVAGCWRIVGDG